MIIVLDNSTGHVFDNVDSGHRQISGYQVPPRITAVQTAPDCHHRQPTCLGRLVQLNVLSPTVLLFLD